RCQINIDGATDVGEGFHIYGNTMVGKAHPVVTKACDRGDYEYRLNHRRRHAHPVQVEKNKAVETCRKPIDRTIGGVEKDVEALGFDIEKDVLRRFLDSVPSACFHHERST